MVANPRGRVLLINNEHYDLPIEKRYPKSGCTCKYLGGPEAQAEFNEWEYHPKLITCRTGSQEDVKALYSLFTQFGFQVEIHDNLTRAGLERQICDFTRPNNLRNADMAVVVILSHGENNIIFSSDRKEVNIEEEVYTKFNNEYCRDLMDKPKLFIIQACRGNKRDEGVRRNDSAEAIPIKVQSQGELMTDSAQSEKVVTFSDMMKLNSTVPGYVAWRSPRRGTNFIQTLCRVFAKHAATKDLREMINIMGEELKTCETDGGYMQPFDDKGTMFTKKLYFNPGLYEGQM